MDLESGGLLIKTILDLKIEYEDAWKGRGERKEVAVAVLRRLQLVGCSDGDLSDRGFRRER